MNSSSRNDARNVGTTLSVVIPARNENSCVSSTLESIATTLARNGISYEIVVVDDGSDDGTSESVRQVAARDDRIRLAINEGRHGYGLAVRAGIERSVGDAIAVMMADGSDSAADLVTYFNKLKEGFDCVFGSRFMRGGRVVDYPFPKLILNRLANLFIQLLFGIRYNDVTNAFKCYRREVIEGMAPLISPHFNLTVEMPLKAIVRGYTFAVVPVSWNNRKTGVSKLKIKEMGSRYLFIVLYMWFEKHLARGDYHRRPNAPIRESLRTPNA